MPVAAVPAYLGREFKEASPGMRFGMYLALWGVNRRTKANLWETYDIDYEVRGQNHEEREVKKENKVFALAEAKRLNPQDRKAMRALLQRQEHSFVASVAAGSAFRLDAFTTAPFTTGLGNEHPLENGFAFLNPYGLPYLPGSGVKGVVRQAARELAAGDWGDDPQGWSDKKVYELVVGKDKVALSAFDALFGSEQTDGEKLHVRGALSFWDVIPQIKGDNLAIEIMTPHQGHYYQDKRDRKAGDSSAPHDSGQPSPISFLTVPPGSGFIFHVQCDLQHLSRIAPELAADGKWKALVKVAFEHAFMWLGFGAKTAVGYGQMSLLPDSEQQRAWNKLTADFQEEARLKQEAEALKELSASGLKTHELRVRADDPKYKAENSNNAGPLRRLLKETVEFVAANGTDAEKQQLRELADSIAKTHWNTKIRDNPKLKELIKLLS